METQTFSPTTTLNYLNRLKDLTTRHDQVDLRTSPRPLYANGRAPPAPSSSTATHAVASAPAHKKMRRLRKVPARRALLESEPASRNANGGRGTRRKRKKKPVVSRMSTVQTIRNEAILVRTPEVSVHGNGGAAASNADDLTVASTRARALANSWSIKCAMADNDTEEEYSVITASNSATHSNSGSQSAADFANMTEAAANEHNDDRDDDDDDDEDDDEETDDGYATTLLQLAFVGLDSEQRAPVGNAAAAAVTAATQATPLNHNGDTVVVSLAAYTAMQTESNELRAEIATLHELTTEQTREIARLNDTIRSLRAALDDERAKPPKVIEIERVVETVVQMPVVASPTDKVAEKEQVDVVDVVPKETNTADPPTPEPLQRASKSAKSARETANDDVQTLLRASHSTRVRSAAQRRARDSFPHHEKVSNLMNYWKQKALESKK